MITTIRSRALFAHALVATSLALAATPARADDNVSSLLVIITRDLAATPARQVLSLDENGLSAELTDGRITSFPADQVIGWAPASWYIDSSTTRGAARTGISAADRRSTIEWPSTLTTTDGSRLYGKLTADTQGDEGFITWTGPLLGPSRFKLEQLASIIVRSGPLTAAVSTLPDAGSRADPAGPASEDTALLRNGDLLRGFVQGFAVSATGSLVLNFESSKQPAAAQPTAQPAAGKPAPASAPVTLELPLDRVDAITFNNPAVPPSGARIWLTDDSIIAAPRLTKIASGVAAPSRLTVTANPSTVGAPAPTFQIDTSRVAAVNLSTTTAASLASCVRAFEPAPGATPVRPASSRPSISVVGQLVTAQGATNTAAASATTVPFDARDIDLPCHGTMTITLPTGTTTVSFAAMLPDDCRVWGDCQLQVELITPRGPRPLTTITLNADRPTTDVQIDLEPDAATTAARGTSSASLRFTLRDNPAGYGPIQDRVTIRRGLLVRNSPQR